MNPRHLSTHNEHYTPSAIVEAARVALGGIDLDPASNGLANEYIRANAFFTKKDDGLSKPWAGTVFLNPPGGKVVGKSSAKLWWTKLVKEHVEGAVSSAVFVGFTLEVMMRTQSLPEGQRVCDFPVCIPKERIKFLTRKERIKFLTRKGRKLVSGDDPTHANAIVYLGPNVDRFITAFESIGVVMLPVSRTAAIKASRLSEEAERRMKHG